ncbi:MAG: gas vesicle protein [Candidatus Jettenia sp. CY-1]|nr:gas vesicle protein [Candidatus Jettenia sp.]WKZ19816.1 MAG: gas vesicle protein [Candidatus Jettenia sp. CY-1]
MGEGELQQGNDQIQNQPRVHLSVEEKELIEKRTEDLAIPSFLENQHLSLCETLDRVLNTGVVIHGDITISVANIDLIYIGLKALLTSVETARQAQSESSIQRFNRETYK